MKSKSKKIQFILLTIVLFFLSFLIIVLLGSTFIMKLDVPNDITNMEQINIEIIQDSNIIKCTNKKLKNNRLEITLESVNSGKAYVEISAEEDYYDFHLIYVHHFGVITYDNYFGKSRGDIVIPIFIFILLLATLTLFIKKYQKSIKETIYQYKNIYYLGLILFLSFASISQVLNIINNQGISYIIKRAIGLASSISFLVLPVIFIVSILVTISSIVLIKREGFTWKNLLSFFLGIFLCFLTILPDISNNILQTSNWINVHNEQGIALYIQYFFETFTYGLAAYLECILISTILLEIKALKQVPEFNKDFIIILGCKIGKDGTLPPLLKGRVDRAIEFRNKQKEATGKDLIFIPSGGKGFDEITSEAEAMKNYLLNQGISKKNILVEDKSTNTYENMKFSNQIIEEQKKNANILFSTTNYHVFRSGVIATNQKIKVEGIGSKTKTYFFQNAFIREFTATIFSEKKKHLLIVLILSIMDILMIGLLYLSNVI